MTQTSQKSHAPQIFDRALLRQRLNRAARAENPPAYLFERVAEDIAFRLSTVRRDFPRVLDLGSPMPTLAQMLAAPGRLVVRAAPTVALVGPGGGLVADDEVLPFKNEAFDLVVCALNLHYVNDLPGALAQIRRTLAPNGLFLAALIGGQSLQELRICLTQAQEELEGGASPRVAPFADLRDLGGLLQRAGLALPVTDCDSLVVRFPSALHLMRDLRFMGAANPLVAGARRPLRRATLLRAAALYAEKFSDPDGKVRATFEIIWASGWAPHESQQKPLAPGSAQAKLSDALGDKSGRT